MAWRPLEEVKSAMFDFTVPGKVTGYLLLLDKNDKDQVEEVKIELDLTCREKHKLESLIVTVEYPNAKANVRPGNFKGLSRKQIGEVGDVLFSGCGYFEWFSDDNGRVVYEAPAKAKITVSNNDSCILESFINTSEPSECHLSKHTVSIASSILPNRHFKANT